MQMVLRVYSNHLWFHDHALVLGQVTLLILSGGCTFFETAACYIYRFDKQETPGAPWNVIKRIRVYTTHYNLQHIHIHQLKFHYFLYACISKLFCRLRCYCIQYSKKGLRAEDFSQSLKPFQQLDLTDGKIEADPSIYTYESN